MLGSSSVGEIMWFLKFMLFGLLESMFIYILWLSLKTGKAPMGPSGQIRADKKLNPFTYWLWVSVGTVMVFFVVPFMAFTLLSE